MLGQGVSWFTDIRLFEERAHRSATLAQAQGDPAFRTKDALITRFGPIWGYRWALARVTSVPGIAVCGSSGKSKAESELNFTLDASQAEISARLTRLP
jgi:hypothetical protein